MSLPTVTTIADLRAALLRWRKVGDTVALVPTMGALHAGHRALVDHARTLARRVVTSIFVNPTQFGPHEDLSHYPRSLAKDQALLVDAGCDLLYAPTVEAIYPNGFVTSIDPGPLADRWEGAARPGHFNGVATVVAKLLLQAMPDVAVFGEKDYQQLQVIRRVVRDLDLPVSIAGVPTVREADGLALSSRNIYLSAAERQTAPQLARVLKECAAAMQAGSTAEKIRAKGYAELEVAGFAVDYLVLVDAVTLQPLTVLDAPARLIVAARLGATRLIDNVAVDKI